MSDMRVGISLSGDISDLEAVVRVVDGLPERIPYQLLRQGELRRRRLQPANVLLIPLAAWERGGVYPGDDREAILADERAQLAAAAGVVAQLAPALAAVARSCTRAELHISTVRMEDQGGFDLPTDLVAVAAAAGLFIGISITVVIWPDDDDSANGDTEDKPEMETPETT